MAAKLFFSYSHQDEVLRDELAAHLAVMKRQGVIEDWHDRRIDAGASLDAAISDHLERSEIVLCLVSADFFASNYCYEKEMQRALERARAGDCIVIPVILRQCEWRHSPLAALRATPTDGKPVTSFANRDEAFTIIAADIRRVANTYGGGNVPARSTPRPGSSASNRADNPPRSKSQNLRVRRTFKDEDRDAFIEATFNEVASLVENSLPDLEAQAPNLKTRFQRVDARAFSVSIYQDGSRAASGSFWYGGDGIYFSSAPQISRGSFNEMLSVADDGYELYLKPLGMAMIGQDKSQYTAHEAAEYLWAMMIRPLQH